MDRLLLEYKGRIKLVYHYVAPHYSSLKAAEAALCAGAQGKYWEYHRTLFKNQIELLMTTEPIPYFEEYAKELDLDLKKFKSCLSSGEMEEVVLRDRDLVKSRDIRYTPTIFIGGKKIEGLQELDVYKNAIEELLKER